MIRRAALIPLVVAWAACADFVAVEGDDPSGYLLVASDHDTSLAADLSVVHSGIAGPLRVTVDEAPLTAEEHGAGRWTHSGSVPVDSLAPELDVAVESDLGLHRLMVPLLSRSGEAHHLDDGDLLLPVRFEAAAMHIGIPHWTVTLFDASGGRVLEITGRSTLPRPLVIDASVLTTDVIAARVEVQFATSRGPRPYPLGLQVRSSAQLSIPVRPAAAAPDGSVYPPDGRDRLAPQVAARETPAETAAGNRP